MKSTTLKIMAFGALVAFKELAIATPILEKVKSTLDQYDYVLLGELHENKSHHKFQSEVTAILAPKGYLVGFEQIKNSQKIDLEKLHIAKTDKQIQESLEWDQNWPFEQYQPILITVVDSKAKVIGLNLDKSGLMEVYKNNWKKVLPDPISRKLENSLKFTEKEQEFMIQRQIDSHCGLIDVSSAKKMNEVQMARDAYMAYRISIHSKVVAIMGNGHVDKKLGVPRYLKILKPKAKIYSLQLIDEGQDKEKMASETHYESNQTIPLGKSPEKDHCAELKKTMERIKKHRK